MEMNQFYLMTFVFLNDVLHIRKCPSLYLIKTNHCNIKTHGDLSITVSEWGLTSEKYNYLTWKT